MRTVLVTHVTQYTGPGAVPALLRQPMRVVCHDAAFCQRSARDDFLARHPGAECLEAADADAIAAELEARGIAVDAVVSNDVHPIKQAPVGGISLD